MVCAGVFLLTPSKRAYLRYYKDLEDDILGRRGLPAGHDSDAEGLLPLDRKHTAGPLPEDAEEVSPYAPPPG